MEAIKSAFKLGKKDVSNFKPTVLRCNEAAEDSDVEQFLIWCAGDRSLRDAFTADESSWETYEKLARKFTTGAAFTGVMSQRGDTDPIGAARYELRPSTPVQAAGPTKQEQIEAARLRKEEEARQAQIAEAERQFQALEAAKKKKQDDRREAMRAYDGITMSNPIAQEAWAEGIRAYIGSGAGNIGLGTPRSRADLVAALANWKSYNNAVKTIRKDNGGTFASLSTFKNPQNKAEQGRGNVGDTLATRTSQANFILYLSTAKGGPAVNVHIDVG